jgi:cell envelope-related transcriptional attenuator-like protein
MHARTKPNRIPAVLAFLSIGQITVGVSLLAAAVIALSLPSGCVQPAPLLHWDESGKATYVDFSALVDRFSTPCIEAAATAPQQTDFIAPFSAESTRRRADRAAADPGYAHRIDTALNQNRINFLLFGYGETYEPPYPPGFKGSVNVFSLDLATLSISTVTLNHDIRAPEVERYRRLTDHIPGPTRIDQAYPVGGFEVMRLAVEDATALTIDYQVAMSDSVIRDAIDELFGGLSVDVPFDFDAMPIYFNGEQHPTRHFEHGRQMMNGLGALQFIKALNAGSYSADEELTVRKQIVVKALLDATKHNAANPVFWASAARFVRSQIDRKQVVFDFDPSDLILRSIGSAVSSSFKGDLRLPTMGQSVYVVDDRSGDGGVEWVTGSTNPIVSDDLRNGVYHDVSFSIPKDGANPYAPDLVAHYWPSVRALVKQRLDAK